MNDLLKSTFDISVDKKDFVNLEKDLLFKLNFDLQWISPITFLERFERLFNLDQKEKDKKTNKIALKA